MRAVMFVLVFGVMASSGDVYARPGCPEEMRKLLRSSSEIEKSLTEEDWKAIRKVRDCQIKSAGKYFTGVIAAIKSGNPKGAIKVFVDHTQELPKCREIEMSLNAAKFLAAQEVEMACIDGFHNDPLYHLKH